MLSWVARSFVGPFLYRLSDPFLPSSPFLLVCKWFADSVQDKQRPPSNRWPLIRQLREATPALTRTSSYVQMCRSALGPNGEVSNRPVRSPHTVPVDRLAGERALQLT